MYKSYVCQVLDENSTRYNQVDKAIATMAAHAMRQMSYRLVETRIAVPISLFRGTIEKAE